MHSFVRLGLVTILAALLPGLARADEAAPPPGEQYRDAAQVVIVVCESFDAKHRATLRVEHWLRGKGGGELVLPRPFLEERFPRIDQRDVLEVKGRYLLCLDAQGQPRYRNSAIPLPYVGAHREAEWAGLAKAPTKLAAFLAEVIADAETWKSKPQAGLQLRARAGTSPAGGPLALRVELRNLSPKPIALPAAVLELTAYLSKGRSYAKLSPSQADAKAPARVELGPRLVKPGQILSLELGRPGLGADLVTPSGGPVRIFCTLRSAAKAKPGALAREKGKPAPGWVGTLATWVRLTPK